MPGDVSMSRVSFNCSLFHAPVYNGDLSLTETRVIHAGSSSAGLHTLVKRQSFDAPAPVIVSKRYTTMVIVDALNPLVTRKGCLPAVRLSREEDIERHRRHSALKSQASSINEIFRAVAVAVPPLLPTGGRHVLPLPEDHRTTLRRSPASRVATSIGQRWDWSVTRRNMSTECVQEPSSHAIAFSPMSSST